MTTATLVPLPSYTDTVDVRFLLEPYMAPSDLNGLLDRFPEELYTRSPDSHFIRFMTALLGAAGVGGVVQQLLLARLVNEAAGAGTTALEAFYGDPFSFGRILSETSSYDLSGLVSVAVASQLAAQDHSYRSRAIQFLNAARLGTSPTGMRLAAASGVGHQVDLFENYKYLFDTHSDDPLGLPYHGATTDLGEFIIIPRAAVSQTRVQTIDFSTVNLGANPFALTYNGYTTGATLSATATAAQVQTALAALTLNGVTAANQPLAGNVLVGGGPVPAALVVTFVGALANQDVFPVVASYTDATSGLTFQLPINFSLGVIDAASETAVIGPADQRAMQTAIDYLRPVASYPTFSSGRSFLHRQDWRTVTASSAYTNVVPFVTGSTKVPWPTPDSVHWIQPSVEVEAPQVPNDLQQHYVNFHNVAGVVAYTDAALADAAYATDSSVLSRYSSVHVGPFPNMVTVLPFFKALQTQYSAVYGPGQALASYTNPITVTGQTASGVALINGVYPTDYLDLQGVPVVQDALGDFWASLDRATGADILEIDLGTPQAVNYISFEITRKPVAISVAYDLLDQSPRRSFAPVVPITGFASTAAVFADSSQQNPWVQAQYYFNDGIQMIFTRFIRLTFSRQPGTPPNTFLYDPQTQTQAPWTVDVRNLRIGRNVVPGIL